MVFLHSGGYFKRLARAGREKEKNSPRNCEQVETTCYAFVLAVQSINIAFSPAKLHT